MPATRPSDPAYILLLDEYVSVPRVHRDGCYICEDPEFSQMGLPLCQPCPRCQAGGRVGHMAADDPECDDCGYSLYDGPFAEDPVRDHNHERG